MPFQEHINGFMKTHNRSKKSQKCSKRKPYKQVEVSQNILCVPHFNKCKQAKKNSFKVMDDNIATATASNFTFYNSAERNSFTLELNK